MCLIAYVPDGRQLEADVYASAFADNGDGIGIMSQLGVVRFLGKKMLKKAKRYIRTELEPRGQPYAIHFRYATHGAVSLANTHPFTLPDGKTHLMHNGVITWCGHDKSQSDTGVFASLLTDYPGQEDKAYLDDLAKMIGYGNKLCILNADGTFSIVNDDAGLWDKGIWYSNTYSLPDRLNPWAGKSWKYPASEPALPGKPISLTAAQSWLAKYDAEAEAPRYAPQWWHGTDYDTDLRLSTQRDDDAPSALHDGCGLPVPSAYRDRQQSQRAYYRGLQEDGYVLDADYAELDVDTDWDQMPAEDMTEDEAQQQLDSVLLAMRQNRSA